MNKAAELTDKRNGHSFKVAILEDANKLSVAFKVRGWTFANVDFEKSSFASSCNTNNWNGSSNLFMVSAIFGNKEAMVEYARLLVA